MPQFAKFGSSQDANILVVASTQTSFNTIRTIISGSFPHITQATYMAQAKQLLARQTVDHLIINTPAPDEFGLQSALDIVARNRHISVMLLVKSEIYPQASSKTRGTGIYLLSKPLKGQVLLEAVQNMETTRLRIMALEAENRKLKGRIDDMGLITRAKCLLIEKRQMSEEDSHHYLEQTAMNSSLSLKEVAQSVVRELAEE